MNDGIIARRYATAFFKLGKETGQLDRYMIDCKLIQEVINQDDTLHFLLSTTVVTRKNKKNILNKVFASITHADTMKFVNLLVEKRREEYLHEIIISFTHLYEEHVKIQPVTITTAQPYDQAVIDKIIDLLEKQTGLKSQLKTVIDESIIAGFILRVGDKQMDASVRGQLNKIKQELTN